MGLAREGLALIRFLVGVGAEVAANDRAEGAALREAVDVLSALPVRLVLGGHPTELFLESDTVFISPGVPQQLPSLVEARARDVPVSSETQLFFELCPGRIVGITGSAGKTTTTALVGDMLREAGMPLFVGGNIGVPLLDRLEEIGPDAWVVLEMSSFQLEALPCSPPVAAVLNVTPNHLDRHGDMESYAAAKANIVRHQRPGDLAVLNADDPVSAGMPAPGRQVWFSLERPVEGAHLEGEEIVLRHGGDSETVCAASEVHLRGRHNLANVVAASAIASAVGAPVGAMRVAIANFRGVPHRLEMVGEVGRVIFCNDSIATAPERSMASLRSFDRPVVLIAGGRNKRLPLEDWARLIRQRVRALVLMGEAAQEIAQAVEATDGGAEPAVLRARSMDDAVRLAYGAAEPGDVVLLAPGCTSFDMFKDFEARGERFRECVAALAERKSGEEG